MKVCACVGCNYLSLQTSTLLCVKNLQAICGGCVLTGPGWAGGTSRGRGTHGTFQTHRGSPLPSCTAQQSEPSDGWMWSPGPVPTPPAAPSIPLPTRPKPPKTQTLKSISHMRGAVDTEAWFYLSLALKDKSNHGSLSKTARARIHMKNSGIFFRAEK